MKYLVFSNIVFLSLLLAGVFRSYRCRYREKRVLEFLDQMEIGYLKCRGRSGRVSFANKGFLRILELGEDASDISGESLEKLFLPLGRAGLLDEKARSSKKIDCPEYRIKTLKGKEKVLMCRGCLVIDPVTRRESATILFKDVTGEMSGYHRIVELKEKYESLFRSSGDAVIMFDFMDLGIEDANPAAEELTGFPADELVGKRIEELVHPMDREKLADMSRNTAFAGRTGLETVLVAKNGSYRDVLITLSGMRGETSNSAMAVIKDVSSYYQKKEGEMRQKRELEKFLVSSVEREERIKELRSALGEALGKIRELEGENAGN